MIDELEIVDGGEIEEISRTSPYQVITADRLESYQKEKLWGYLERNEMKNPIYYRLFKNKSFVGFKRVVTEYLPAASTRWYLEPMDHDENDNQILNKPAMGIATFGREKITSGEQRKVITPKPKGQTEPTPVPSRGGLID